MTPEDIIDRAFQPEYSWATKSVKPVGDWVQGTSENPVCGDTCIMYVKLRATGVPDDRITVVEDMRHTTEGCTICQCSADLLCENMIGKPIDLEINLLALLGIPIGINRRQCVVTPQRAFLEAIK